MRVRSSLLGWIAVSLFACGGGSHSPTSADGGPGGQDASPDGQSSFGPRCGDGNLDPGEQCDDDNTMPGDGCDATCHVEQGWICPTAGSPCVREVYCGD